MMHCLPEDQVEAFEEHYFACHNCGRILGKYRGDSWPGSPESCTGAPEVKAP